MKMKLSITVLLFIVIFYLTFTLLGQNNAGEESISPGEMVETQGFQPPPGQYTDQESEPEDDSQYMDDESFFLRKLFQKNLQPLTGKGKIIWAFRMADSHSFL